MAKRFEENTGRRHVIYIFYPNGRFVPNLPLSVGLGPVISSLNVPLQIYYQVIAISIECLLYHHTLLAVYSTIFEIP